MTSRVVVTLRIRLRWWFKPACYAVGIAQMLGIVSDIEPLISWISRKGTVAVVE